MSQENIFEDIRDWAEKEIKIVQTNFIPIAVTVTQYAKKAEDTGIPDAIAEALSKWVPILPSLNAEAKVLINKALLVELDLQDIADNATPEELAAKALEIQTAVTGKDATAKSKLWTNFGVSVLNIFKDLTGQAKNTFAKDATALDEVYESLAATLTAVKSANAGDAVINLGKAGAELAQ